MLSMALLEVDREKNATAAKVTNTMSERVRTRDAPD
jgi:hypothetical protein